MTENKVIKIEDLSSKQFYLEFQDLIDDFIREEIDINTLENFVFDEYKKFYDKDITLSEIRSKLENVCEYLSQEPDRCSECLKILDDEDYISEYNSVPYGESYVCEHIATGYKCSKCGNSEKF